MPPPPAWVTPTNNYQVPSWVTQQQQQQQQPPPTSAQSWTYGQYPPALSPLSTWTAPTPAGSWGLATPGGSLGPPTPASANTNGANWVQQGQQGYYTPFEHDSTLGQAITASPWFSGGDGVSGAAAGNHLPRRSSSRKKSRRHSRHPTPDPKEYYQQYPAVQAQQNPYPNLQMERTTSHEFPGTTGYPLQRSTSLGRGPRLGYTMASSGYPQSEEYNARNLARRPRDWRPDYDPRAGLASYIPRVGRPRSDVLGLFSTSSLLILRFSYSFSR